MRNDCLVVQASRLTTQAGTAAPQILTREMLAALAELAKALDYAQQARRTPWDFAVEITSLTALQNSLRLNGRPLQPCNGTASC